MALKTEDLFHRTVRARTILRAYPATEQHLIRYHFFLCCYFWEPQTGYLLPSSEPARQ